MQGILPQAGSALAFQLLASVLYAVLAVHLWRRHWAAGTAPAAGQGSHLLQLAALAVHAIAVFGPMFAGHMLRIGVGDAISAILWLTVLIYGLGSLFYRLEALQALIMPVAAVSAMLPALLPAEKVIPNTELLAFRLHLVLSMLAYSLFTIASLHVLLMAMLERRLHHGALPSGLARLPPLLTMETLLFRIIWAGFLTLTLTLASGIVFSEEMFGR
ncbi:MAG: cytochrome C biogenesis protein, partial [Betaproteobacteria bacterium]|nr:cytochrome C biogenesis protein [Betaproteobacteria bacterium]